MMDARSPAAALFGGAALALAATGCLGNSPSGARDLLYALLVDPQPGASNPTPHTCLVDPCRVRVEIIDLTNHTLFSTFSIAPSVTAGEAKTPSGFANSFAVNEAGDRIFIGERLAQQVHKYSDGGVLLGSTTMEEYEGPIDMVLSSDERFLYVNDGHGVVRITTATMKNTGRFTIDNVVPQEYLVDLIALSPDDSTIVLAWVQGTSGISHLFLIDASTMSLALQASIGYVPEGQCDQTLDDMVFRPDGRLFLLDATCGYIYQFDVPGKTYLSGTEIKLGPYGTTTHFAYSNNGGRLYGAQIDSALTLHFYSANPATASAQFHGARVGRLADVTANVDAVAMYYAIGTNFSTGHTRRLGVVHIATNTVADSAYHFAPAFPPALPRIMEMAIARRHLAPRSPPSRSR